MGTRPRRKSLSPRRIFISYRSKTDAVIAAAVKVLLERAIEPSPRVFVSGLGGLVPSSKEYRHQLRNALLGAGTVIGILTNASKDREWLQFEAGATWILGRRYVPLLIQLTPEDLPSTISAYEVVQSSDHSALEGLLATIARSVRGRLSRRFKEYAHRFRLGLRDESRIAGFDRGSERGWLSRVQAALDRNNDGKARKILRSTMVGAAYTHHDRVDAATVLGILDQAKWEDISTLLDELPTETRQSGICRYAYAVRLKSVPARIKALRELLEPQSDPLVSSLATTAIATEFAAIGDKDSARNVLLASLKAEDHGTARAAAGAWIRLMPDEHSWRLGALMALGLVWGATKEFYEDCAGGLAKMPRLIRLLSRSERFAKEEVPDARNWLGISLQDCGMRALAYTEYAKAASEGIAVASVNAAQLLLEGAVASAAIERFPDFAKPISAENPAFPFDVRARAEKDVSVENERLRKLLSNTRSALLRLGAAAHNALHGTGIEDSIEQLPSAIQFQGRKWNAKIDAADVRVLESDGMSLFWRFDRVIPGVTALYDESGPVAVLARESPTTYVGIDLRDGDVGTGEGIVCIVGNPDGTGTS